MPAIAPPERLLELESEDEDEAEPVAASPVESVVVPESSVDSGGGLVLFSYRGCRLAGVRLTFVKTVL